MPVKGCYKTFVDVLANKILSKLNGTHPNFNRFEFPDSPSKIIILGTLGDKSKDYSSSIGDETRTLTSVKNNSMSVKFLTKESKSTIIVTLSLSLFYRVYPTLEEEKAYVDKNYVVVPEKVEFAKVWKRHDCEFESITINISKQHSECPLNFQPLNRAIKNDKNIYKRGKEIESKCLENQTSYEEKIKELGTGSPPNYNWKGKLLVETENFPQDTRN